MEFFPMLCKENSKLVTQEYADATDTLEFLMKCEYLPNNVLHRLMVERWTELDTENVWLTGARFIQLNTGLSAIVRIDGSVLQIYVRSENDLHSRNTYLSVIEGSVDQIRQERKLTKPKNRLVYKFGYRRPAFDYERLPADFVKACCQLQAEKHYWGTKENPRNSYIRNALDNMGYVLRDQMLRGISGGETVDLCGCSQMRTTQNKGSFSWMNSRIGLMPKIARLQLCKVTKSSWMAVLDLTSF